ncbi:protein-tyrosine phosphatase-like protein [Echria macrotheca]|uniref:Protein-tyrosine phosphatase-like protein n=1 Tax=Echria macrotheca TaxID=438768 RepID=A0AAJ0BA69_9PEZI|nr:protein-tyrosine phosphatase-like protein [Echria macrotheca]
MSEKASALLTLALTDVTTPLPKADLIAALSSSPFIPVDGTFNTRDLGQLPGSNPLRPGLAFRSGSLAGLAESGKATLRDDLKIRKIFDLRSVAEHAAQPDPAIDGVEIIPTPSGEAEAVVDLADFLEGKGEAGYAKMYTEVLRLYQNGLADILRHVRDFPGEPFLFHCNAGRDRTGVAAGMLLGLAGADEDTVVLDFMLSRIGTEPAREMLLKFAMHGAGVDRLDTPGFYNLCSLTKESWKAFGEALGSEFGGWEGYVTGTLGFSREDLETIRKNLRR